MFTRLLTYIYSLSHATFWLNQGHYFRREPHPLNFMLNNCDVVIADPWTALTTALKLIFRFGGFQNLGSVISFPYCIHSYFHYCLSFQGYHQALQK